MIVESVECFWLQFKDALEMIDRRFKPLLEASGVAYTVEIVQNFSQTERVAQPVLRYLNSCNLSSKLLTTVCLFGLPAIFQPMPC